MIDETITGDVETGVTTPTASTSDVSIGPFQDGAVALQAKAGANGVWETIVGGSGSYSVSTPDSTVEYRFKGVGLGAQNVPVFFGP